MADDSGFYVCLHSDCVGRGTVAFKRPCELKRHMDKHERPYKCPNGTCKDLPGFTYAGGLLRHQREVHATMRPHAYFYCPYPNCNRSAGDGFTRRENLSEHLRRRHPEAVPKQSDRADIVEGSSTDLAAQVRPLRKRILEESRRAAQRQPRRAQSKWFKAPSLPGMAAFDLLEDLVQVPYTKKTKLGHWHSKQPFRDPDVIAEAATWSSAEHTSRIMAELDGLAHAASSSSAPSSSEAPLSIVNDDSRIPLSRLPSTLPVSEPDLIAEVQRIYAGLVMVQQKCSEIITSQSQSKKRLQDIDLEELLALHRTLLAEHHDFFLASQHPSASDPLKKLAAKYAMPARMWQTGIRDTLNLLKLRLPTSQTSLASFTHLVYMAMNQLEEDIPQLSHEWDLLRYSIREYFAALRADGFSIPVSFLDCWEQRYSPTTRLIKTFFPPMRGDFFGDDQLSESYFRAQLEHASGTRGENGNLETPMIMRLSHLAQYLMAGWLQYGRKIATSFHAFTHVFIFLALCGVAAYSMGPAQ